MWYTTIKKQAAPNNRSTLGSGTTEPGTSGAQPAFFTFRHQPTRASFCLRTFIAHLAEVFARSDSPKSAEHEERGEFELSGDFINGQ
jgi:hypothetical protein